MSQSKKVKGQIEVEKCQRQTSAKSAHTSLSCESEPKMLRWLVLLFFAASFLVHTILNMFVHGCPTVVIDEGLYTNIARSLAWEGKLAFRGQPIDYPYILYPLFLVPVYWLAGLLNGDVYRFIQVLNTLLITSSVFPAMLFAKSFTESNEKAVLTVLIVSLMPDMLMGAYTMTECLIWPLSLWMVFFCYRFYSCHRLKDGLLTALFTGLLFFTKPGAVAVGAVMLVLNLIVVFRTGRKQLMPSILPCLLLTLEVGAVYGIYRFLSPDASSLLGLYTKQTAEWGSTDAWIALEGTFLLSYLFCFACGGIWIILPLMHLKQYDSHKGKFILSLSLGVLTAIIGTAVFVVPYKWDSLGQLPLYLRYCSMYVPAFFVFAVGLDIPYSKINGKLLLVLLIFMFLAVFPGVRLGFVEQKTSVIDSMNLAAFIRTPQINGKITGWILTVFVFLFLSVWVTNIRENDGWKEKLQKISVVFFGLFVLYNSVCAYFAANVYIDPTISVDALEVNRIIGRHESLGITQRHYSDIYSYWLDSRLISPMQQVTMDQMVVQMKKTDGSYVPFVPLEQAPNILNHETPETDTLVLGMTIAEHLEMSDTVLTKTTENGHFTVVKINGSEPWVDTMMYGLDDNMLYSGSSGYIWLFNENRNMEGSVYLSLKASGTGCLIIDETAINLTPAAKVYDIIVPFKQRITFSAENGNVEILNYSTAKKSIGE